MDCSRLHLCPLLERIPQGVAQPGGFAALGMQAMLQLFVLLYVLIKHDTP